MGVSIVPCEQGEAADRSVGTVNISGRGMWKTSSAADMEGFFSAVAVADFKAEKS